MSSIAILWDDSYIWGLLAWRAVRAMEAPFFLARGEEIAQGLLSRKRPSMLLAPGGMARSKACKLGEEGMAAIRDFVESGGSYLGFCGGAGLGLTSRRGLGLCPWTRAAFKERVQHFVSGHMRVAVNASHLLTPDDLSPEPLIPVWWPARFSAQPDSGVEALASYVGPGPDFWVADLELSKIPPDALAAWSETYGVHLGPALMAKQPCVVAMRHGKGRVALSYAHLETPNSPEANAWFAHLLREMGGARVAPDKVALPPWRPGEEAAAWEDPILDEAKATLDEIIRLGKDNLLLFQRESWLLGWRAGLPGANLNNLYSMLCQSRNLPPRERALAYWREHGREFRENLRRFKHGVTGYLMAERLALTLSRTLPEAVSAEGLREQRDALFGPPMSHGGLYGNLLSTLDEVTRLQIVGENGA